MKASSVLLPLFIFFALPGLAGQTLEGQASWYGPGFHGRLTANGERYNMYAMTAAHKTLPFGTFVEVTLLSSGRKVVVRINDRGPFADDRIIDLSKAAAERIGLIKEGVSQVQVRIIKEEDPPKTEERTDQDPSEPQVDQYIQIGAYGTRENALERARAGQDLGMDVAIYFAAPYYRVFILTHKAESQRVEERLKTQTNWDYLLKELPPDGEKLAVFSH
jgi:rare lipoprotein A